MAPDFYIDTILIAEITIIIITVYVLIVSYIFLTNLNFVFFFINAVLLIHTIRFLCCYGEKKYSKIVSTTTYNSRKHKSI